VEALELVLRGMKGFDWSHWLDGSSDIACLGRGNFCGLVVLFGRKRIHFGVLCVLREKIEWGVCLPL